MVLYINNKEICDLYYGNTKIGKLYVNNKLIYATPIDDSNYIKKPNYSSMVSRSNNTIYQATNDIWLNVVYNVNTNPYVYVSQSSDMSNQTLVAFGSWASGVSSCKGGCIIYIPKGLYYRGISTGGITEISTISSTGRLAYKYKNKVAKVPNYFSGESLAQNTVASPRTTPCWLYSYGSTRIVQVSKDNSNWITIATGVTSASVEPSAVFYIPAGYYFKTTGSSNCIWNCKE